MKEFLDNYRSDKQYRAKVKLLLYVSFVVLVTIYAISANKNIVNYSDEELPEKETTKVIDNHDIIKITDNMKYDIKISIDDNLKVTYHVEKTNNKQNITKEHDNITEKFILDNGNYYKDIDNNYIKINIQDIYNIIDYNYLDLNNINLYLEKAEQYNQEYLVYLKDIVLNNESDEYFVILINNNNISIDYTPLMKLLNSEITSCQVAISIKE